MRRLGWWTTTLLILASGCDDDPADERAEDAATDASPAAARDAAIDAGRDATIDAGESCVESTRSLGDCRNDICANLVWPDECGLKQLVSNWYVCQDGKWARVFIDCAPRRPDAGWFPDAGSDAGP